MYKAFTTQKITHWTLGEHFRSLVIYTLTSQPHPQALACFMKTALPSSEFRLQTPRKAGRSTSNITSLAVSEGLPRQENNYVFKQTTENLYTEEKCTLPRRNMRSVPAGKDRNGTQILKYVLAILTDSRIYWSGSKC